MKQKYLGLGILLSKTQQKIITGGYSDGGQCWNTCEQEFNNYCLNNINNFGHSQYNPDGELSEYYKYCLGVENAQAYCLKKCTIPVQPASQ